MAPDNGIIDCSLGDDGVPTNRDTCTVTCNYGFMLRGDATRTCRITHRRMEWLGDEARCVAGMYIRSSNVTYNLYIIMYNSIKIKIWDMVIDSTVMFVTY